MKDNKLIFEINRIGQLMGTNKELPLIVEVNLWFRLLTKASFSNVDDLIKIFRTRVGPNISAKEIDDLIKELGNSITQSEKITLKNALVNHLDGLKSKVLDAGGGIDPETGNIKNPKEEEKVFELMVGGNKNGEAYKLVPLFNTYIQEKPTSKLTKEWVEKIALGNAKLFASELSPEKFKEYVELRQKVYDYHIAKKQTTKQTII